MRGALLALCAVALGLGAHGGAGGAIPAPSPWLVVVAVAVGGSAAIPVRGTRRLGALRSVATLGAGQLALHLALAAGDHAHATAGTPDAGMTGMAGMPGMDAAGAAGSATAVLTMVGAHALATLVVAALVAGADRAAVATVRTASVRWAHEVLALLRPLPVPAGPATAAPVVDVPRIGVPTLLLGRVHPRRGPPLFAV